MAKTYDTYKDSGIAWIGEIPGDWEVCRYKNICTIQSGFPFDSSKFSVQKGFPLIRIRDITSGKIETYYDGYYPEEYVVKKGDLIIGMDGDFNVRLWQNEDGLLNQRCCRLYEKKCANKSFLFYTLPMALRRINDLAYATTVKHLSNNDIYNSSITLPPLSVQQSISSFLDTKCGEIDSLISIQEEMISELLAYKQSVITEAVTKGLDKKAKMKNSGVEWIGDIPEEWEVIKIQYLNQGLTDGTHGTYNRVDKGRLLLSSKNVREKDLLITDSESQISEEDYQSIISNGFPKKGDLLMCCIGASIGRCIIYKYDETYAFQRSVIFIRCNKLIKPELLRYNLLSNNSLLQELFLINQSAQAGLYQGQVKEIKVIVPPISKQKQIIDYLDKKTSQIDSLIALKLSKIESLKEYKKSIIYEYVTGKKRV